MARMGIAAMALFPVWISNGLWHGPKWSYIFYGLYYFGLIFMGLALEPVRDRILAVLHIDPECMFYKAFQTVKMLIIIFTGEMFSEEMVFVRDFICLKVSFRDSRQRRLRMALCLH